MIPVNHLLDPTANDPLADISPIGRGYCSNVYPWGANRVLKLFHAPGDRERARREFAATKAVHTAGLPAPATFELVEVNGRAGIVMERLEGPSLLMSVQVKPWTLFRAARMLAELHARVHAVSAPPELPSQKDWLAADIDAAELSNEGKRAAHTQLDELPGGDSLCHGDMHPGNVILTRGGPVVIDWETASRGHPLGDVACTCRLMRVASLPAWSPAYMHWLLRCGRAAIHSSYLRRYLKLRGGLRGDIEQWRLAIDIARRRPIH